MTVGDLRFGRADGGLGLSEAPLIFTWRLTPTPDGVQMRQEEFAPRLSRDLLGALARRALGRRAARLRIRDRPGQTGDLRRTRTPDPAASPTPP